MAVILYLPTVNTLLNVLLNSPPITGTVSETSSAIEIVTVPVALLLTVPETVISLPYETVGLTVTLITGVAFVTLKKTVLFTWPVKF